MLYAGEGTSLSCTHPLVLLTNLFFFSLHPLPKWKILDRTLVASEYRKYLCVVYHVTTDKYVIAWHFGERTAKVI